jgi:hypothetical protein
MNRFFYTCGPYHISVNGCGGYARAVSSGKTVNLNWGNGKIPSLISYILRYDRFCLLAYDDFGFYFLQNYTISYYDFIKQQAQIIAKLDNCRSVFYKSVCITDDRIIFFDYSSSGRSRGLRCHEVNMASKTYTSEYILGSNECQRVISAHKIPDSNYIIFSTGDTITESRIYEYNYDTRQITLLMHSNEDLRFMNIFQINDGEFCWFSNNRTEGSKYIHYSRLANKIIEKRELGKRINIWHTLKSGNQFILGETIEPVRFKQSKDFLHVYSFSDGHLEIIKKFKVQKFRRLLRYPTIEFTQQSDFGCFINVSGTVDDGSYLFDGRSISAINYYMMCCETNEDEFKRWNVSSGSILQFWKSFMNSHDIQVILDSQAHEDYRHENLRLKLIDKLTTKLFS